jgi:hypothetical protein
VDFDRVSVTTVSSPSAGCSAQLLYPANDDNGCRDTAGTRHNPGRRSAWCGCPTAHVRCWRRSPPDPPARPTRADLLAIVFPDAQSEIVVDTYVHYLRGEPGRSVIATVTAAVALLIAIAVVGLVREQSADADIRLANSVAPADDVEDPAGGMWLTMPTAGHTESTSWLPWAFAGHRARGQGVRACRSGRRN